MSYDGYKLVRDKIPEIIKAERGTDECERVYDKAAYRDLLIKKLHEEVAELDEALESCVQDKIEGEVADVYEVLIALAGYYQCRDVVDVAEEKYAKRGGFYRGYIYKVDNSDK